MLIDEELETLQEDDSKEIIEKDGKMYMRFVLFVKRSMSY